MLCGHVAHARIVLAAPRVPQHFRDGDWLATDGGDVGKAIMRYRRIDVRLVDAFRRKPLVPHLEDTPANIHRCLTLMLDAFPAWGMQSGGLWICNFTDCVVSYVTS